MAFRNLLVVTGNYDIVQQIRQGLEDAGFAIHTAYSHLDVLYRLKYESFEVIVVDAEMVNRNTGDHTASTLARLPRHPPLLIYAPPPLAPEDELGCRDRPHRFGWEQHSCRSCPGAADACFVRAAP